MSFQMAGERVWIEGERDMTTGEVTIPGAPVPNAPKRWGLPLDGGNVIVGHIGAITTFVSLIFRGEYANRLGGRVLTYAQVRDKLMPAENPQIPEAGKK